MEKTFLNDVIWISPAAGAHRCHVFINVAEQTYRVGIFDIASSSLEYGGNLERVFRLAMEAQGGKGAVQDLLTNHFATHVKN